jgi:hypothetical protein
VKALRKMLLLATITLAVTFLLSLGSPALANIPPKPDINRSYPEITIEHNIPQELLDSRRPPPGLAWGQDLGSNDSQDSEERLGGPNYWASGVYALNQGSGGYTGVYAHIYPQPVNFETDWWTDIQEYWVQVTVRWDYHYFAEIGLDVVYWPIYGGIWRTFAYAGYSEDPTGMGVVLATYIIGDTTAGPVDANLGVYRTSGGTWEWTVNGVVFATHTFPETWQGYMAHSVTEAYNQPVAGTSGQYISLTDGISLKRADNGLWTSALYQSGHADNGIFNGWMVNQVATDGYRYDWSTRS